MTSVRYCKKCKKAYDIGLNYDTCPECRNEGIEIEEINEKEEIEKRNSIDKNTDTTDTTTTTATSDTTATTNQPVAVVTRQPSL